MALLTENLSYWEGAHFVGSTGEGPMFMPSFARLPPATAATGLVESVASEDEV